MQRRLFYILLLLFLFVSLQAQDYKWRVGLNYFFDNEEYSPSSFTAPQTMNGVWLNTLGGMSWSASHAIFGGVNFLKVPGMSNAIDKVDVTLFYQYETPKVLFRAGAFPRKEVLSNYSDFFFRDSVNYFMPQMQGFFWQVGNAQRFFNAWLDWTGYATPTKRESFYIGFSGKISRNNLFTDFQSYMFHYAGPNPGDGTGVSEQLQALASVGATFEAKNGFHGLLSAGILVGAERIRKENLSHSPIGFVARTNAEHWGIGTETTFYFGNPRMKFYPEEGSSLYWQNPFLRFGSYVQNKWYIRLLETPFATARLNYNLHFTEGKMLSQQVLTVSANIDNFSKRSTNRTSFPWTRLFR